MTELPTPAQRLNITGVIDRYYDRMSAALDNLGVNDETVLEVLRSEGYEYEANIYQDWLIDEDPARDYREPNPPEGVVPDPPNPSYEPLVAQLQAQREATSITYEWVERERQMFSCRATVNRSQFQTWLSANVDSIVTPEEVDAETLVEFLEADYSAVSDERRWPAESNEVDHFDLKVVQPDGAVVDPLEQRQALAFQMLREAKDVPPNGV
jgi:hypothetical protein